MPKTSEGIKGVNFYDGKMQLRGRGLHKSGGGSVLQRRKSTNPIGTLTKIFGT
jgi:hypothetical protein